MQDSRGRLETEVRKVLHEVSRIAKEALVRAHKLKGRSTGCGGGAGEVGSLGKRSVRSGPISGFGANAEPLAIRAATNCGTSSPQSTVRSLRLARTTV
jgi:hypothetical protein